MPHLRRMDGFRQKFNVLHLMKAQLKAWITTISEQYKTYRLIRKTEFVQFLYRVFVANFQPS